MPWVPGYAVRVLTHERAQVRGQLVVDALVALVRRRNLAGITITRALEGTGHQGHLRTSTLIELSDDLPLIVEIVDRADRVEPILTEIAALVTSGVLTVSDVRLYFPASALLMRDVMVAPREVINPEAPLTEALTALLEGGAQMISVVGGHQVLQGIVTLGHLLQAADPALAPHLLDLHTPTHVRQHLERLVAGRTVRECMLPKPLVLHPEDTLEAAARFVTSHAITCAPVVDSERHLVGIVSERILVTALVAPLTEAREQAAGGRSSATTEASAAVTATTLTDGDLGSTLRLCVLPGAGEHLTAGVLADHEVPVIPNEAPWEVVLQTLQAAPGDLALVVTDDGHLHGIIDERAVLEQVVPGATGGVGTALHRVLTQAPGQAIAALRGHPERARTAATVTRAAPVTVPEGMLMADALARMMEAQGSDMAVVLSSDRRPLGILRRNEALRAMVDG